MPNILDILFYYGITIYAVLFPALIYLCWITYRDAGKQNLYLWIWMLSPLILPLLVLAVCVGWPVYALLRKLAILVAPLYTALEKKYTSAKSILESVK